MEDAAFKHEALVYEDADDYLSGTMPLVESALQAQTPVLIAVGPAQTEWLQDALGGEAGAVGFLPMEEVGRTPASIIPLWRDFVEGHGDAPVAGIGEPVWAARSPSALEECHRHE